MTFKEKLMIEHPQCVDPWFYGGCYGCPRRYGYETETCCPNKTSDCEACWNRTIPGTENDILKGEKEMADTRKTKKELLEEIAELKKEVERADQRKKFEDAAIGLKMQYDALVEVGFDNDNALKILNNMIKAAGGMK